MSTPSSPTNDRSDDWNTRSRLLVVPLAWVVVFLIGLGLGSWLGVSGPAEAGTLDHRVWSWIVDHRDAHPAWLALFRGVTRLGNSAVAFPLVLVTSAGLFVLGRMGWGKLGRSAGWFFLGAMLGSWLLLTALKASFVRERPPEVHRLVVESSSSFPSSHSLNSATFVTLVVLLLGRAIRSECRRSFGFGLAALVGLAIVMTIAASRAWLGVHYLSDVLCGITLGLAWALSVSALYFGWPTRSLDRTA